MAMKENNSQAEAPSAGRHQFCYFTWEVYREPSLSNYLRDCQRCLRGIFETLIQIPNVVFTNFSHQPPHGTALLQPLAKKFHKPIFALTGAKSFLCLEKDQAFSLLSLKSIRELSLPPEYHKCFFSDSRRCCLALGCKSRVCPPFVYGGLGFQQMEISLCPEAWIKGNISCKLSRKGQAILQRL